MADSLPKMSFTTHLSELRRRLLWSIVVLVLITGGCFVFCQELFELLRWPLKNIPGFKLMVTGPFELFVTYIKLSVVMAVFISAPFILWQVWAFISPGLYAREKRWILPFVFFGTVFFLGGGAFAYFVVLPIGFGYLVQMTPPDILQNYVVSDLYTMVVQIILAFGIIFELPLLMWILSAAGLIQPATYSRFRKYWLIAAVVIGGVLTPPDPFTQILMAVPLILFYELGIIGAKIIVRAQHREK